MKLLLLYGFFIYGSILGMEEFTTIKALLKDLPALITYLESQDTNQHTPLMRLFDKGTDAMIEEILPLLKGVNFNIEKEGPSNETAIFFACDRPGTIAATLMAHLGAQLDPASNGGRPLYLAFYKKNLALLEFLLTEGANPKVPAEVIADASTAPNFADFKALVSLNRLP